MFGGLRAGGDVSPAGAVPFPTAWEADFSPVLRARLLLLTFAASFHLGQCLEQPRGILEQAELYG